MHSPGVIHSRRSTIQSILHSISHIPTQDWPTSWKISSMFSLKIKCKDSELIQIDNQKEYWIHTGK